MQIDVTVGLPRKKESLKQAPIILIKVYQVVQ